MAALTRSFPFDTGAGGNVTEAQWREMAKHWVSDGLISTVGSGMAVTATTGMVLQVAAGAAFIQGHYGALDVATNVTVSAADPTLPRIDRVVLRLDALANAITAEVVAGTPHASPTAPALTQTSATWEISLATVAVAAATATIVSGNLTDARTLTTPNNGTLETPLEGDGIAVSGRTVTAKNRQQSANPIRNASMVITQRGQTFAVGATTPFTIDSWRTFRNAVATGLTVTTQDSEDSQGSGFSMRLQRDSGNTSVEPIHAQQSCESVECRRFRNRTATISARVRVGANYSGGSTAVLQLITGTGSNQSLASGFTGQATALTVSVAAPTTSWATVTGTVALGSITQFGVQAAYTPSGTAGAADWLEIKDVRVDEGAYAQEHVPLPYALDLAECQRFFYRQGGVGNFDFHGNAYVATATIASLAVQFPVTMRAIPTLSVSAAGGLVANDGSVAPVSTAIALSGAVNSTTSRALVNVTCGAGGLTVGRSCIVYTGGTAANGILDFSAEI